MVYYLSITETRISPFISGVFFEPFVLLGDFGHEVSTARGRLEGALQVLIEKTESEGSDESDVDVTDLIHEGRRYNLT